MKLTVNGRKIESPLGKGLAWIVMLPIWGLVALLMAFISIFMVLITIVFIPIGAIISLVSPKKNEND